MICIWTLWKKKGEEDGGIKYIEYNPDKANNYNLDTFPTQITYHETRTPLQLYQRPLIIQKATRKVFAKQQL